MGTDESAKSTDVMELRELTAEIIQLKKASADTAEILKRLVPVVEKMVPMVDTHDKCRITISDCLIQTNTRLDSVVEGQEKTNENLTRITRPFDHGVGFLATTKFLVYWGAIIAGGVALAVGVSVAIITMYAKYNDNFVQAIINTSIG